MKPADPVLEIKGVSPALLAKALGKHRSIEKLDGAIRGLAGSLDKTGRANLLATTCELARRRGPPSRDLATLAACARVAGGAHADRALADLVVELRDGPARRSIADVLLGWQTAMKPAVDALATLLDDESVKDEVVLRGALHGASAANPTTAQKRWHGFLAAAALVRSGRPVTLARLTLAEIETHGGVADWIDDIAPLAFHPNADLSVAAGRLVSIDRDAFLAFLAWVLDGRDTRKVIAFVDESIHWAMLGADGAVAADLAGPLGELLGRARDRKERASLDRLTRVIAKLEIVTTAEPNATEPIATVGTEGGPPLVVPAVHLKAWLGASGPEPYDSGNSDYERACDVDAPALIAIGKGRGIVLPQTGVDVFAEPTGLYLLTDGEPGDAIATGWRSIGSLVVGRGGIVVLDSVDPGSGKHVNRKTVPLTAGTYNVLTHRPRGKSSELSAVRLVIE